VERSAATPREETPRMETPRVEKAPQQVATLTPRPEIPHAAPASAPSAERSASSPPRDADTWKARAVELARSPEDLAAAVDALEQLLRIAPEKAGDTEVRRIVTAAATSGRDASPAAFRLMSNAMGSKGPDLLYELMLEQPELSERAKFRLTRFSVRRRFSPQLSIAFDLLFAATCAGRTSMLQRAHELGDQRSINVLSSLVSLAPNCGRGGPRCAVACPRESAVFTRSIELITQRLRSSQRAASVD
jgi:hypothetical protein